MRRGELTESEWERIEPLLAAVRSGKRGHPYTEHRRVINGILWVLRTGAPWADMPTRYGSAKTCWDRFNRWQQRGLWARVVTTLQQHGDAAATPIGDT